MSVSAPILAVDRHRMHTDGEGVTTLVVFAACPLECAYCINDFCHTSKGKDYTAEMLYRELQVDQLYFLATNGGVTFGGGEPGLRAEFIADFRACCGDAWKINIETSLYVSAAQLKTLLAVVDHFYVDIKDWNADIYQRYTKRDIAPLQRNLQTIVENNLQDKVTIRLPLIPYFNQAGDRDWSEQQLRELGFRHFDRFDYVMPH